MRKGYNPNKRKKVDDYNYFHQVIIPVYIPNLQGYFKESLNILKYTLESLLLTSHENTFFTIVNNGSCNTVIDYLNELFQKKVINELIHTVNIGKFNAILKGISAHNFTYVTITDADVFFMNNWQEESYAIFSNFKKVGVVSTTPSSKMYKYLTNNLLLSNLFSKKLKFSKVKDKDALQLFANSIGNPNFYNEYQLDKYLTIRSNNCTAVVGAGHFVATYRKEVIKEISKLQYSDYKLGSEIRKVLDYPVEKMGLWRLSTQKNLTYHMGNTEEQWMKDKMSSLEINNSSNNSKTKLNKINASNLLFKTVLFFFKRIFNFRLFKIWFLKYKGLSKLEAKNY